MCDFLDVVSIETAASVWIMLELHQVIAVNMRYLLLP